MIKLTENYSLDYDRYQFILINHYDGKDKKGEVKKQQKQTYHGTLEQVAKQILNQSVKEAKDICEMSDKLLSVAKEIAENLSSSGMKLKGDL